MLSIEYQNFTIIRPVNSDKRGDIDRLIIKKDNIFGVYNLQNNDIIIIPIKYKLIKTVKRDLINRILKKTTNLKLKKKLVKFSKGNIYEVTNLEGKQFWLNDKNRTIQINNN